MDYNALWTLIENNAECAPHIVPSTPKVSADTARAGDQAIANILNSAAGGTIYGVVTTAQLMTWGALTGMRAAISDEAYNVASPLRSSALALLDVMQGSVEGIDFGDSQIMNMLDAWVLAGKCSSANRSVLLEKCSRTVGLAEWSLGSPVTAADVSRAVRGPRD